MKKLIITGLSIGLLFVPYSAFALETKAISNSSEGPEYALGEWDVRGTKTYSLSEGVAKKAFSFYSDGGNLRAKFTGVASGGFISATVYNTSGRIVGYTKSAGGGTNTTKYLDWSGLSSGTYYLEIYAGQNDTVTLTVYD